MYERRAWLIMEARRRKSPTEDDQLAARSGARRSVMPYLGCCCLCRLFIELQPLGFVVEEVMLFTCAVLPLCQYFFFLPLPPGETKMSLVITGCVSDVSRTPCVCIRLSTVFSTLLPFCLVCLLALGLCVAMGWHWLLPCSLGHCPGSVYLSIYSSCL